MHLLKSFITATSFFLLASTCHAQTPEEWANNRAEEIMKAPLTLKGANATSWYMIPERELRAHNVDQVWYATSIKLKLNDYAMQAEEPIKAELQQKFDTLTFKDLKKQRENGQKISYCWWLMEGDTDGVYGATYDLKAETHTHCDKMAETALHRMLDEHINEQSTKLDDLAHLDLEFPAWLIGDLSRNIDTLKLQSDYLEKLGEKINLAAPQLTTAFDSYFAGKVWRDDPIISAESSCRNMLANLAPKRSGNNAQNEIYNHCVQAANEWLQKTQPQMIAALTNKMKTLAIKEYVLPEYRTHVASESDLCQLTMFQWFRKEPQGLDDFIAPIYSACLEQAKPIVSANIEQRAKTLSDKITTQPATLQSLMLNNFFALSSEDIGRSIMGSQDEDRQSVADRVFAIYQNNIWQQLDKAQTNAEKEIDQLIDNAAGSILKKKALLNICSDNLSGSKFIIKDGIGGANLQALKQKCIDARSSFPQKRIVKALERSKIQDLGATGFVAETNQGSQSWPADAFVAMLALNDFQVHIEKGWFWQAPNMTITPMGLEQPSLSVTLEKKGNNYVMTAIDPLPAYSTDPLSISSCLTYTNDQFMAEFMLETGKNMLTAFFSNEIDVDISKWFNVGACIGARNAFLSAGLAAGQ